MALKEKFRKERQRIKNWIRLERTLYFNDLANNALPNPKTFWSFFSFKTRANQLTDTMIYQGITISDDTKMAESFQRFFNSIDLFTDTAAILISIVSNSYYGMPRGKIHINLPPEHPIMSFETIEIKMAAVSVKRSILFIYIPLLVQHSMKLM